MSRFYTHFSCLLPLGGGDHLKPALALYQQFVSELQAKSESVCFSIKIDDAVRGFIRFDSGDDGDPEQVIAFVQRCAKAFGLSGLWGFQWSHGCRFRSLDAFSGAACLLDLGQQRVIETIDCQQWLSDRIARGNPVADSIASSNA